VLTSTASFSAAGLRGCRLTLRVRLDTAAGDGLGVDAIRAGGAWTRLGTLSGSSGGRFVTTGMSMAAFDGREGIRLRLVFVTGGAPSGDGVQVDDLRVACLGDGYVPAPLATESGTSFAAPMVSGVAALVLSRYPWFTAADVRQALLEGVVARPALAGVVATGGRLSAPGALAAADRIAARLRPAAPAPAPTAAGPTPSAAVTPRAAAAGLGRPARAGGVWRVSVRLGAPGRARVTLSRRAASGRWVVVRRTGVVRRAAGTARVALGRLGAGRYRVAVRVAGEGRTLTRTWGVAAARR
jgi:subtilisin family serine protease